MSGVRILPLVVLVGLMVLSMRVVNLFSGGGEVATTSESQPAGVSMVQMAQAQAPAPTPGAIPEGQGADVSAAGPGLDDPAGLTMEGTPLEGEGGPNDIAPTLGGDPTLFTQEEIDLLQNLSVRRGELDRKEQRLDERESLIAAAEARIDAKIEEMKSLKTAIEGLVETKEAQEDDRIKKLISVYEKMKPKDAARIWNDLDMDILLQVALGMREANTAAVLSQMTPERARALTAELAYKQDINMLPLQ